jgi:fatty acid desaturase
MMISSKFKIPGIVLLLFASILSVYYFLFDFRFSFPVFAVISSYSETKFFWTFSTNFADELILLLFTLGFSLTIFSREKAEYGEYKLIRKKAIYYTIMAEIGYLIFIILFSFGSAFIALVVFNLFLPFIFYLIFFNLMKFKVLRNKQKKKSITT